MQVVSYTFTTSDNFKIKAHSWVPDNSDEIKGIVQLHHGLAEHVLRYDRLGSILAENGYILNAYDMRGHGATGEASVTDGKGMMGKLADKNGFDRVVQDLNEIIVFLRNTYSNKPVFLLGHSFGSFVSQAYIEKYGNNINGCILSGTAGPQKLLISCGSVAVKAVKLIKGGDTFAPGLDKLAFGAYNNHIENPSSVHSWISKNEFNVEMYDGDNWCGFPLTVSFYNDMMTGLLKIHKRKNMKAISKDLPLLLLWGSDDPVGGYGKTIQKLCKIYTKNGIKNLQTKVYEGDRHEILNESNKEEVENDILKWLGDLTNTK